MQRLHCDNQRCGRGIMVGDPLLRFQRVTQNNTPIAPIAPISVREQPGGEPGPVDFCSWTCLVEWALKWARAEKLPFTAGLAEVIDGIERGQGVR